MSLLDFGRAMKKTWWVSLTTLLIGGGLGYLEGMEKAENIYSPEHINQETATQAAEGFIENAKKLQTGVTDFVWLAVKILIAVIVLGIVVKVAKKVGKRFRKKSKTKKSKRITMKKIADFFFGDDDSSDDDSFDDDDDNNWTCSCGYVNSGKTKYCGDCGNPKPVPIADWTCSCGYVNSGKIKYCGDCGNPRP